MRHRIDTARPTARNIVTLLLICLCLPGVLHAARTAERQSPQSIREAIVEFAEAQDFGGHETAKVVVGQIDPRLRLKRCERALQVFFNSQQKRASSRAFVGVRCELPAPWTIYVPINLEIYAEVAMTRHPLRRGHRLNASDLLMSRRNLAALPSGYFTDPAALIGMETSRQLAAQTVFSPYSVKQPKVVQRGEQVALVIESGSISVRMRGKALDSAALGERVRVKNNSSGRVVEGHVSAPGVVKVSR